MRVKSSLARKVFLAVFGTAALLVITMTVASLWRLDRSFLRYVHQVELQRLQGLVGQMQREWQRHGSWDHVPPTTDVEGFRQWFEAAMGERRPPREGRPPPRGPLGDPGRDGRPSPDFPPPEALLPPGLLPRGFHRPPDPRPDRSSDFPPQAAAGDGPPREGAPRPERRAPPDRLALVRRVALFDGEGRHFGGAPLALDRSTALPIQVDARTVAYVDLVPLRLPAEEGERAFLRSQWRDALVVGGIALLLSAAVSMAFARHLRRPVRQLVEGTRALTQGQLDVRLPAERRDEFGLLCEHFNQLAQQLQQQERGRREWLASTSHELRTPLSVLQALIEAMQEGIRQGDAATLQRLHDQVRSLSRLVDDLHELARHDTGSVRLHRQALHPKALIEAVLDSQHQRLAQAGIRPRLIDHTADALIDADPQRLSQLVHNLVENCCRYTDAPGQLEVQLRLLPGESGHGQWLADFDDSPPGLPEADRLRLFERFFRAEASRSRATGGSGLGLSICRAIAEEHGGHIEALASPLGGLRVRLVLPVAAPPAPARSA